MRRKKRKWKPETLNIRASIGFDRKNYTEYFRMMLHLLDSETMCFMIDNEPITSDYLSIILNKAQSTVIRFLKEANSLGYIASVFRKDRHIYFANPYIFKFLGNRTNKSLALLFDKKELKNEKRN